MTSQSPHINRWRAFALLAVSFFMTVIDLTIVNVSLPTIGRDLHFSQTNLQWVVTAYALTFGGFLLLGGRAADLLGRRRILMLGLGLFSAASLGAALATGAGFMIGARAVQGIGAAIMLPAALSIVMNMFQEGAERNKALGIWGGLGAGGATVGVIAGGLLTRYAGWQYIFYLNVPIGAVALLLAPRIVPESRLDTARRKFDALGALSGTAGLVLLVDAISQAPQYGWGATRTIGVLAAAAVLLDRVPGDRAPGRGADPAAVDLPAADARRARTSPGCCWAAASTRSSSSAPCTCSRFCTTARCRPASPGWRRH